MSNPFRDKDLVRQLDPSLPVEVLTVSFRNVGTTESASLSDATIHSSIDRAAGTVLGRHETATIYCLDVSAAIAIFAIVRKDDVAAGLRQPFFYDWVRGKASRLVAVPMSALPTATPIVPLSFIMSVGRSGSSLLCNLLLQAGMKTIAEPDSFTSVAIFEEAARKRERLDRADHNEHVEKAISICVQDCISLAGPAVVKLRGVCSFIGEEIQAASGGGKAIFLFRDITSWVRSNVSAFGPNIERMVGLLQALVGAYETSFYLRPTLRLDYGDLVSAPLRTLERTLTFLGEYGAVTSDEIDWRSDVLGGTKLDKRNSAAYVIEDGILTEFHDRWRACHGYRVAKRLNLTTLL